MIGDDDSFTDKVGFVYSYKLEKIQDTGYRGSSFSVVEKFFLHPVSCILYPLKKYSKGSGKTEMLVAL
jgi:hypothetical protein